MPSGKSIIADSAIIVSHATRSSDIGLRWSPPRDDIKRLRIAIDTRAIRRQVDTAYFI